MGRVVAYLIHPREFSFRKLIVTTLSISIDKVEHILVTYKSENDNIEDVKSDLYEVMK